MIEQRTNSCMFRETKRWSRKLWTAPAGANGSTSDWPRISIVTPSFNQADYLEETLLSVISQGYPNLQYIVIDGGSTDGSRGIIEKYQDYIDYWVSEKDSGHAAALNKGFDKADGEVMGWINSDDKLFPWSLFEIANAFRAFPEVHWLTGLACWFNERGVLTGSGKQRINLMDFACYKYQWIQQESTFWTRSIWERAGAYIDEEYRFMVDGELWCRFFKLERLHILDVALGGFRQTGNNRSTISLAECHVEMKKCINRLRENIDPKISAFADRAITRESLLKGSRLGSRVNRFLLHRDVIRHPDFWKHCKYPQIASIEERLIIESFY